DRRSRRERQVRRRSEGIRNRNVTVPAGYRDLTTAPLAKFGKQAACLLPGSVGSARDRREGVGMQQQSSWREPNSAAVHTSVSGLPRRQGHGLGVVVVVVLAVTALALGLVHPPTSAAQTGETGKP